MNPNMLLFADKHNVGKEVRKYNHLQQLDAISNEMTDQIPQEQKTNLAKYIHKNYNKMDDMEMRRVASKCLDISEVKDILMTFEFNNYTRNEKEMTLNEFTKIATYMFDRYYRVGGCFIEDKEWIVHTPASKYFDIPDNKIMFQNTIDSMDADDCATNEYLNKLVENLNGVSTNIRVKLEFIEKKKLTYITIWAKDTTLEENDIVGL